MIEQKKKIVLGAKQYAQYIVSRIPQVDEKGNVHYYFSGSLAMLLLSSAKSMKSSVVGKDGKVIKTCEEVSIPEKSKESLAFGVRPISFDIDVVSIDDILSVGSIVYNLGAVRENCDLAVEICSRWKNGNGTAYFDCLSGDRMFESYDVAELTMEDGTKIIVADPLCMLFHKLADAITIRNTIERLTLQGKSLAEREAKYQKDINDFVSMFNAMISLYPNIDFNQVVNHILESCRETAFSNIMNEDFKDKLKQFYRDAKNLIAPEYQDLFKKFIEAIATKNKEVIAQSEESVGV